MDTIQQFIISFVKQNAMEIFWIIILFFLGRIVLNLVVKRLVHLVDDGDDKNISQKEKRAETLGRIIITTGNVVIYIVTMLMVLSLFGVNITPILAGAGVIGLAIGFGAQSLVKDFVSGLFILVENQYGIGDRVKIGGFEGRIIRITMRSTVIRNDDGQNFHISNGLIKDVTNLSQ